MTNEEKLRDALEEQTKWIEEFLDGGCNPEMFFSQSWKQVDAKTEAALASTPEPKGQKMWAVKDISHHDLGYLTIEEDKRVADDYQGKHDEFMKVVPVIVTEEVG